MSVREGSHDTGAPPDFLHDELKAVVRAQTCPIDYTQGFVRHDQLHTMHIWINLRDVFSSTASSDVGFLF